MPRPAEMAGQVILRGWHLRLWRGTILVIILFPFIGLIAAGFWWNRHGLDAMQHTLFLVSYLLTGFGVTVGYHRLFTHRSFKPVRWLELSLAVLGSMAMEGPVIRWVAEHRRHHQYSDKEGDPHSPHSLGEGLVGLLKGFVYAHLGWFFDARRSSTRKYASDLYGDRYLRKIDSLYPLWVLLSVVIPGIVAYAFHPTQTALIAGFLWGGLARIFFVQHVTWSVNSACHLFGSQDFATDDQSRNNWVFGILALGEGWHNGHHAFPSSAQHGLLAWQLDLSYITIRILESVGLVRGVHSPDREKVSSARVLSS